MDSIVLPINTTHYALELGNYLDQYATSPCINVILTERTTSVEAIAATSSFDVDFSSLRSSINELQVASIALDQEKVKAERQLKKVLRRIVRRRLIRRKIHRAICKLKKVFGKECGPRRAWQNAQHTLDLNAPPHATEGQQTVRPRVGRAPVWMREQQERRARGLDDTRRRLHKRLLKAVKRVRAANKKLVAFERGLISEEGIKDREWYKHLGVAPGKWLGACSRFVGVVSRS